MMKDNLFLCGFMGSGKSTIGRKLALLSNYQFIDLDSLVVERMRMSIPEIFSRYGEEQFRKIERECLVEKLEDHGIVMALGGGTISDPALINKIKASGYLIFLRPTTAQLVNRLSRNRKRPLLLNDDGSMKSKEELTELVKRLYEKRMPQYLQADYIVDIPDGNSADQSAQLVFKTVEKELQRG
ncbi:MAG TPA: shikimate kinase [Balneolales bacterium]|nr:shikimate kinase [Balneolales bacterium]